MSKVNNVDASRPLVISRNRYTGTRILRRLPQGVEEKPYNLFQVKPLSPLIGAEIAGVDLRNPLTTEVKNELHRALLEWKVIFFRNQHITNEQHIAFGRNWGELEVHPFLPEGDSSEIVRFTKGKTATSYENIWHNDVTFRQTPARASILRVIKTPPLGGDTIWADTAAAYDNLPDEVKERIDGLTAIHDFTHVFGHQLNEEQLAYWQAEFPIAEHPVVIKHPATGRKTLFVNQDFTVKIVGLNEVESEELLQFLFQQIHIPEYQVRFKWEDNSIAFWDNFATQHYAVADYYPNIRIGERVAIVGERPAGVK
jgi:taurine dioxygenase